MTIKPKSTDLLVVHKRQVGNKTRQVICSVKKLCECWEMNGLAEYSQINWNWIVKAKRSRTLI